MQTSRLPHLTLPIARSFVAVAAAIYLYDLFQQTHDHFTNGMGRPFGDDFINFWSGAYLAVHGHATQVYDPAAFHAFQQSVVGGALEGYLYIYPPVLLVLTAPLGLVPYIPALVLWLSAGWFAFYRALCLALPGRGALLLALATPAVFINTIAGQNGTWTAALFGGGLGLLNRRPMLAGGLLGLLVFKPQLAILIPVALAAGRHWRALAAAAVTAAALLAVSALWFGTDIWINYIRLVELLRRLILEEGTGVWYRFVSVFVAARRLGVPVETTYLVQGIATVLAGIAVVLAYSTGDSGASVTGIPGIYSSILNGSVFGVPTPLLAFCCDCVRAAIFAFIPLAIDIPAESSEPELIFKPVDNCVRVFCRFACVLDSAFSAVRSETLFRMDSVIGGCSFGFANERLYSA